LISDKPQYEGLMGLNQYRNSDIDEEIELSIDLNRIEHQYWPEMVDNENLLFGGQAAANSITALPKREIKNA
ncbi:MAG: hypothetical protein J7L25_13005, partial [Deltaproteobacteria bacterium]|nr:hypothetical protein [Candidatus Tharpella aukensis]